MFFDQFTSNAVKPPKATNLFDIRQKENETLKEYLSHFCDIVVCIHLYNEEMFIYAFVKEL